MAYIIMADILMRQIFEKASPHLLARGHHVDITTRAQEVLQFMEQQEPDVLILSSMLHGKHGFQLLDDLHMRYPAMQTQLIWIAAIKEDSGEPAYSWDSPDISTYLAFPCSEWQIVLSVEQLLYRAVIIPTEQKETQ